MRVRARASPPAGRHRLEDGAVALHDEAGGPQRPAVVQEGLDIDGGGLCGRSPHAPRGWPVVGCSRHWPRPCRERPPALQLLHPAEPDSAPRCAAPHGDPRKPRGTADARHAGAKAKREVAMAGREGGPPNRGSKEAPPSTTIFSEDAAGGREGRTLLANTTLAEPRSPWCLAPSSQSAASRSTPPSSRSMRSSSQSAPSRTSGTRFCRQLECATHAYSGCAPSSGATPPSCGGPPAAAAAPRTPRSPTSAGCRLVSDKETGKAKGYGFCEYHDQASADSAVRNLNGYDLSGRQLRVGFAEEHQQMREMGPRRGPPPGARGPGGLCVGVKGGGAPADAGDGPRQGPTGPRASGGGPRAGWACGHLRRAETEGRTRCAGVAEGPPGVGFGRRERGRGAELHVAGRTNACGAGLEHAQRQESQGWTLENSAPCSAHPRRLPPTVLAERFPLGPGPAGTKVSTSPGPRRGLLLTPALPRTCRRLTCSLAVAALRARDPCASCRAARGRWGRRHRRQPHGRHAGRAAAARAHAGAR